MKKQVTLRPSGRSFSVDECESVLIAALRQGIQLPHSCRGGSCRSCAARLLQGETRYPLGPPIGLTEDDSANNIVLLCQAEALTDLEVEVSELRLGEGISVHRVPCRVERLDKAAPDVMIIYLRLPAVVPFRFLAGQYLDILMRDGRRRSFSIASPPHDSELIELHVRQVPGGEFTAWVFDQCEQKSLLRIEGPMGSFVLDEEASQPMLFVAGGTGFAPIKSMLRHAFHVGLGRPMDFFWGARKRIDLYQHDLVLGWADQFPEFSYTPVLSEAADDDAWEGRKGLVHEAVTAQFPDLSGRQVYISGPPPMIEAARRDFAAAGLPGKQLHFDSFEYAVDPGRAPRA